MCMFFVQCRFTSYNHHLHQNLHIHYTYIYGRIGPVYSSLMLLELNKIYPYYTHKIKYLTLRVLTFELEADTTCRCQWPAVIYLYLYSSIGTYIVSIHAIWGFFSICIRITKVRVRDIGKCLFTLFLWFYVDIF